MASKQGLEWLGQRYSQKSADKLLGDAKSIKLHEGWLKNCRGEWGDMNPGMKALRLGVFGMTGAVAKILFKGVGRGEFDTRRLRNMVEECKNEGRTLITASNHVGTIDDPVLWGALPWWWVLSNANHRRWVWASQEICHKTRLIATGFGLGQCIPVVRGAGLSQPAVAELLNILPSHPWIHVFPEAMCNQTGVMKPFKWGIAHVICQATTPPRVLVFAHQGMENMYPEDKTKLYPRFCKVRALTGPEVDISDLWEAYQALPCGEKIVGSNQVSDRQAEIYKEIIARIRGGVDSVHSELYSAARF